MKPLQNKCFKPVLLLIFLAIGFLSSRLHAQEINQTFFDSIRGREVLIDFVTRDGLQNSEFTEFYQNEYQAYEIDEATKNQLKDKLSGYDIVIILASWCSDSKTQVPRFIKLLDTVEFPDEQLLMIAVDSQKQASGLDVTVYDIQRVPTFILYKNGSEQGRIIESPRKSLEIDLLQLLQ
ncbi:MAG: thioredoxin family protein [Bacteroidales bacterium]|nr:thioredoxin family protein [Bacteroidales bacterium]HOI31803.1 thioredoxin family protein [Bacteroidales bacterium]